MTDAGGTFLFDQVEDTFGRLAFDLEQKIWVDDSVWQGGATICIISSLQPDPMAMIDLAGTFYQVLQVISGDSLGATIRYRASAISGTVPTIKNAL